MRIIDLAIKDLWQIIRDKRSLLFLIAMPIAFTVFMGFAYRSGEDTESQAERLALAWVNAGPENGLGAMLYARIEASGTLKLIRMDRNTALESLARDEVDGVLIIPVGFGEHSDGSFIGDEANLLGKGQLTLVADPASPKGQSLYQLLRVPVTQLMSSVEIGQMNASDFGDPAEYAPALELAWEKWEQNGSEGLVNLELAARQASGNWFGDNPYNQSSPGILIQFAIMGLITSAQILVQERKSRTLQRQMTTDLKAWEIMVGHLLAMFGIILTQTLILETFGQLILGVDYLREPVSILLVSIALGLWVASMGLLIGLLAEGENQVIMYSMIAMFLFSALGGAWFPLETAGRTFSIIGKIMPSAWAMTGLQNVLIRGLGFSSTWLPASILIAYSLVFLGLAVWRFKTMEI